MMISPETDYPADRELAIARRMALREELALIPELMEQPPQQWVGLFVHHIHHLRKNLDALAPQTQEYLKPALEQALSLIRQEQIYARTHPNDPLLIPLAVDQQSLLPEDREQYEKAYRRMRGIRADHVIMTFSRIMAEPFTQELVPVNEIVVPIEEIIASYPNESRFATEWISGHKLNVAYIKHPYLDIWQRIPLPFDRYTAIKGGGARILNGLYAGAPKINRAGEIPQHDTDLVMAIIDETGEHLIEAWARAAILGADESGVEFKSGDKLDYQDYANSRDMTVNMSWVARDGLHTCPQAIEAAKTGIADISGNYRADKAIYNTDRFAWYDFLTGRWIIIPKQRGISREVKATAEEKILGFTYMDISANTPLGIYALWLVKRWAKYMDISHSQYNPDKFGLLLQRMFFLAQDMGHVPSGIGDVMGYLEYIHADCPYFDFGKNMENMIDQARWKGKRLAKQLDREYGWATGVPSNFNFMRQPDDTVSRVITLEDFRYDPGISRQIAHWYDKYMKACQDRTDKYDQLDLPISEKYFFDLDVEEPFGGDI